MKGKAIDFEELELRNESTISVGNMNVSAQEEADNSDKNNTVASSTRKAGNAERRRIDKQPQSTPVMSSAKSAAKLNSIPGLDEEVVKKPAVKKKAVKKKAGGLADAIAKTKEVKQ